MFNWPLEMFEELATNCILHKEYSRKQYIGIYVDSEEQETSYEAQVTHYTNFIRSHDGWELAGIFADEGLSGTQAKTRTQFNALIAA